MEKEPEYGTPPAPEPAKWSRRQLLAGTGALGVVGLVALFGKSGVVDAARAVFGSPVQTGKIYVYQYDYYFVPNYMTWRVGDTITIALRNQSHTHWHEWVVGRHLHLQNTIFGVVNGDAFKEDFFNGVHVTLSHPYKVDNFVPHKAIVTYEGPKSAFAIASGGDFSPTLQPGGAIDITFTVPDKPGIWHYGCFVQNNMHWRAGMQGIVNILPA
ncbi:conserved protein of unknown function [Candidatus Hydrogenisulfobacillus filiaventi]|uniref:Plastocyanin-like domain-containing protein n=1 Tax=Candidatus Hydrogenisulfobacillus filiaventi TaxID=2707344 RepID=A0A6F8ZI57_9FIRM|nr:hypothetical protein [Bacillota bacterium]CAB1129141.1 conserved protein of unknown function [Candidatus Hydrogenisulfobacillus filiaventi]